MDPHFIVFFPEEENMVAENESDPFVKLKDRRQAPDEKPAEWIEFLKILDDDFIIELLYGVVLLENRQKIIKVKLLRFPLGLLEFLVDLLYYAVGYHSLRMKLYKRSLFNCSI